MSVRKIFLVLSITIVATLFSCMSAPVNNSYKANDSLISAAHFGTYADVEAALKSGTNIDQKNEYDVTPLMFAVNNKDLSIAKLLIEKGANVNAEANGSFTPLFYAVENNRDEIIEVIQLLVAKGADLEHKNYKGQTVLLYAAEMNSNTNVINALIEMGADIKAIDNKGNGYEYYLALPNKGKIY